MKRILLITCILSLLFSFNLFAKEKIGWKQPPLKEGQTIQEAFEELRQNRNQKIERRKQEAIQERKDNKKAEKTSKNEAVKEKKEQKKQEKKLRRIKASKSQIDKLEPRKYKIDDLTDITHENVLLDD